MRGLIFFAICCLFIVPCQAKIITVDDDGPADFNNIQSAIDDAVNGDVVEVQPGQYVEDIDFLGKNIKVTSTNPGNPDVVASTIIGDVWPNESEIQFRGTEDPNCILTGFRIKGSIIGVESGSPYDENHTHATISYCVLQGNRGRCGHVIIACDGLISNCIIANNRPLNCFHIPERPPVTIIGCHGLIKNCAIVNNQFPRGRGIETLNGGNTTIENCIIYNNYVIVRSGGTLNIRFCDIYCDRSDDCNMVRLLHGQFEPPTLNWGPGNISTDPCFVQVGYWDDNGTRDVGDDFLVKGDYHLQEASLCINAGDPNFVAQPGETDLDGQSRIMGGRIDIGVDEYCPGIQGDLDIVPQILNLRSGGKWIICHIRLGGDCDIADIDTDSILLEGQIPAVKTKIGSQILLAKFRRADVQEILKPGKVELTLTGELIDGTIFECKDMIKVVKGGKKN